MGTFISLQLNGKEQLASPMMLGALRAPTDNDRKVRVHWVSQPDGITENLDRCFRKIYSVRICDGKIIAEGSLAGVSVMPFLRFTQTVTVYADGTVDFDLQAKVNEPAIWLPRFGYEFTLVEPNAAFRYFGMGPGETYRDLHHYAGYGLWQSDAQKEYVPYLKPQDHGNHYGVRYLAFENGLGFTAEQPFEFCVSQYSTQELMNTPHAAELTKDGVTHVRVDYKVSGIGSGRCGPALLEKYRLSEKEICFRFQMKR